MVPLSVALPNALNLFANSAVYAGMLAMVVGFVGSFCMLIRASNRTKQGKASKLDVMFLTSSTPGFSKLSLLNSPDTLGIGVFAALSLEQIGAMNDMKDYVDISLRLYREWSGVYLLAARYSALVGDDQKAIEFLTVARTMMDSERARGEQLPQLEIGVIESLVNNNSHPLANTITLDYIFDEFSRQPYKLVLSRSVWVLLYGFGLLVGGMMLHIIKLVIT